jgi:hypothetical protein
MISNEHRLRLNAGNLIKQIEELKGDVHQAKESRMLYEKAWHEENRKNHELNNTNIALRNENNRLKKLVAMKIQDLNSPQTWVTYKFTKEDFNDISTGGRKITVT